MKKLYYIDYPQEHLKGQMHRYQCVYCKVETTVINGTLERHLASCQYRKNLETAGYETAVASGENPASHDADDFD
jgi:hypothetical protein